MNLAYSILLAGMMASSANAKEPTSSAKEKKLEPLSEAFLLFLADMEEIEGELMHPVDVSLADSKKEKTKQVAKQPVGKRDENIE